MATVHETYNFDVPVERLYAHLSVHENLKPLLGVDVERIQEGDQRAEMASGRSASSRSRA